MEVVVRNLMKNLGGEELYDSLSLEVNTGEIVALMGPNGSGKTTLLNIVAGIDRADSGNVCCKKLSPLTFSYIFQDYRSTLFPWRSNLANLAYPLTVNGVDKITAYKRVNELIKYFEFDIPLKRYPYQLSGGQQQLLTVMRSLITKPKLLFADEPFSALDYEISLKLRDRLGGFLREQKITMLMVSHNIEEAVHLADKIIVLSKRPTAVVSVIRNNLTMPRTTAMLVSKEFQLVKAEALDAFIEVAF